jgi:hypothetical protein
MTTRPPAKKSSGSTGRGRRKRSGGSGGSRDPHEHKLSSHPTSRGAQSDTRAWLLRHYGPYCAYCGLKFNARVMTLDHVAPRRGLTAYDRRDNLVLACRPCNEIKRDQAPLAFLLGVRARAANLLKFGAHLSAGLLELARPLVKEPEPPTEPRPEQRIRWNAASEGGRSPYRD